VRFERAVAGTPHARLQRSKLYTAGPGPPGYRLPYSCMRADSRVASRDGAGHIQSNSLYVANPNGNL
jgi:hypothetical protein